MCELKVPLRGRTPIGLQTRVSSIISEPQVTSLLESQSAEVAESLMTPQDACHIPQEVLSSKDVSNISQNSIIHARVTVSSVHQLGSVLSVLRGSILVSKCTSALSQTL